MSITYVNNNKEQKIYEGCVIADECVLQPHPLSDKLTGYFKVFDNNSVLLAELHYRFNKLYGDCKYYSNGTLQETIPYQNNLANGWGKWYDDGCITHYYYYQNGVRTIDLSLENGDGFWKEKELSSNAILSICQYSFPSCKKQGIGFVFENGILNRCCMFQDGIESQLLKSFKEGVMSEFQSSNLVYEGGYDDHYDRQGKGKLYHGSFIVYDGEWNGNVPNGYGTVFSKEGSSLHEGVWCEGKLETKDFLVKYNDNGFEFTTKREEKNIPFTTSKRRMKLLLIVTCVICLLLIGIGCWIFAAANKNKTIHTKEQFDKLSENVKRIVFESNSCNEKEFVSLDFSRFKKLELLQVGDNSLVNVKTVAIKGLEHLTTITIGHYAFEKSLNDTLSDHILQVENCHSLESIEIGEYSFVGFSQLDLISNGNSVCNDNRSTFIIITNHW